MSPAVESFPKRHAASRRFTLGAPRSFTVSDDGETVLYLQSSGPDDARNALWKVSAGSEPSALFAPESDGDLTAAEKARRERMREQAGGVVSYVARPDLSVAMFVLGGVLHSVDVATGEVEVHETDGGVFDPTFEPGGDDVAYVSGRGMRIVGSGADRPIPGTFEDDELVTWGSAEFVAAEEMGRGRGYWWAPEGRQLVACRVDTSNVEQWWISSPTEPAAEPRSIRYPAAGTQNADVQLWVVDVDEGPVREIDWRRGEFEYLASVVWAERLILTVQTRDQRTLVLLEVDSETGEITELQRVNDEHWVELQPRTPMPTVNGLVTIVDDAVHDRRTLAIDGVPLVLNSEGLQVRGLVASTDDALIATVTTDATDSVLASISFSGDVEFLTEPGSYASGTWSGGTLVEVTANPELPTSYRVQWSGGAVTEIISVADEPRFRCTPEFHSVGDRSLNIAVCLPADHDGSPLPVLLDPYGGPHAQRVVRSRNAYATSQWFAEQGFAVVVTDGRGTPGRGPAFEREIYGDFASKVLDDQIDALHALAETNSAIDLNRVGIRGWSFGGYLAALAVMRRPDAVHAAIAGAPVTEWRLYDTHYTERYLGHPDHVPSHYDQSSLLGDAGRLERPLMLIHGLADDNVVAAHTLQLSRSLLEAGKPHEVLPLSNVTHMTPQVQVAENLLHLQRDFLLTHLSGDL